MAGLRIFILSLLLPSLGWSQKNPDHGVRIVIHPDGNRTEILRNVNDRSLTTITRDPDGNIVKKQTYFLDAQGREKRAAIYDPTGNLLFHVLFEYDPYSGKLVEEGMYNRDKELVRLVKHRYDANGQPLPAHAFSIRNRNQPLAPVAPPIQIPVGNTHAMSEEVRQAAPLAPPVPALSNGASPPRYYQPPGTPSPQQPTRPGNVPQKPERRPLFGG
ncbi:MAG: hypothetical protein AAF555_08470 [Verrucomicrobiota bacterium]